MKSRRARQKQRRRRRAARRAEAQRAQRLAGDVVAVLVPLERTWLAQPLYDTLFTDTAYMTLPYVSLFSKR